MKINRLKTSAVALSMGAFIIGVSFVRSDDGIAGKTGAPGEQNCTGCHSGNTLNASGGSITISAPGLANGQYFPGATYPVSVTVSRSGAAIFGFGFGALKPNGTNGGTLAITAPTQTQLKSAVISGNTRTNVVHQLNAGATSSGSKTFSFNWTAPASGTGPVTFYAAGNATNGSGTTSGDFVYTTSLSLTESATSLEENVNFLAELNISPNPSLTNESINIAFALVASENVKLTLIGSDGREAFVQQQKLGQGKHNLTIPSPNAKGIYFLRIGSNAESVTRKIVVI